MDDLCNAISRCIVAPDDRRMAAAGAPKAAALEEEFLECQGCKGSGLCPECGGKGNCGEERTNVVKLETSKRPDGSMVKEHVMYTRVTPKQCPRCGGHKPPFRGGVGGGTTSPFTSNDFGPVSPAFGKPGDGACRRCNGRGKVLSSPTPISPARRKLQVNENNLPSTRIIYTPEKSNSLMPIITGGGGSGFRLPEMAR